MHDARHAGQVHDGQIEMRVNQLSLRVFVQVDGRKHADGRGDAERR